MAKRGLTPGSKSPTLSNWIQWRDRAGFPPASHFALMRLCLMRLYTGPSAMSISVTATGARPQARLKPRLLSFEARRTEGEGSPGDTEGALIDGAVLEGRGLGELLGALREFTESGMAEDQLRWRHLGDQLSRRARGAAGYAGVCCPRSTADEGVTPGSMPCRCAMDEARLALRLDGYGPC